MIWVLLFIFTAVFFPVIAICWAAVIVVSLILSVSLEVVNKNNKNEWIRRL